MRDQRESEWITHGWILPLSPRPNCEAQMQVPNEPSKGQWTSTGDSRVATLKALSKPIQFLWSASRDAFFFLTVVPLLSHGHLFEVVSSLHLFSVLLSFFILFSSSIFFFAHTKFNMPRRKSAKSLLNAESVYAWMKQYRRFVGLVRSL